MIITKTPFRVSFCGGGSDIKDFYKNVMDVIEHKAESKIRLSEVERVMRLMEAIFTSAQTKQTICFEQRREG